MHLLLIFITKLPFDSAEKEAVSFWHMTENHMVMPRPFRPVPTFELSCHIFDKEGQFGGTCQWPHAHAHSHQVFQVVGSVEAAPVCWDRQINYRLSAIIVVCAALENIIWCLEGLLKNRQKLHLLSERLQLPFLRDNDLMFLETYSIALGPIALQMGFSANCPQPNFDLKYKMYRKFII